MADEIENAQEADKSLSENARKLVELIVKIIVNATYREIEGQNNTESIRKKRKGVNGARTKTNKQNTHCQLITIFD